MSRSSHQRCSVKKRVFNNLAKFTRKHLCQSLFLNKVEGLRPETLAQMFSYEFCEISRNTVFTEHLWAAASGWRCFKNMNIVWKLLLKEKGSNYSLVLISSSPEKIILEIIPKYILLLMSTGTGLSVSCL